MKVTARDYAIAALTLLLFVVSIVSYVAVTSLDKDVKALTSFVNATDDGWVICSRDCAFTHYTSHLKWEGCFSLCKEAIKDTGAPIIYDDDSYTKKAKPIAQAATSMPAEEKGK